MPQQYSLAQTLWWIIKVLFEVVLGEPRLGVALLHPQRGELLFGGRLAEEVKHLGGRDALGCARLCALLYVDGHLCSVSTQDGDISLQTANKQCLYLGYVFLTDWVDIIVLFSFIEGFNTFNTHRLVQNG